MAGAHQIRAPMNIVDLRQTTVRQIEPLLEEEARHWRDELHWDYRGALELIKRFMEARALAGCVAFEGGSAAGYSFYVLEEQKGLIGGLYVSCKFPQEALGRRLLEEMLFSMRAIPHLMRIEAQLMPFSGPFRRLAPCSLERPLLRSLREADLPRLRQSRRWRNQRSVPQPRRRAEIFEEYYLVARMRAVCSRRIVRSSRTGKR